LRLLVTTTFAELSLFHSTSGTGSDVGYSLGIVASIPPDIAPSRDMPTDRLKHRRSTTPLWSRHDHTITPETP